MKELLDIYYADNASKLHGIVDRILLKYGGLSEKDKDDFYSLANEVFVDVMRRYDRTQPFEVYLYSCLSNRIKTEITRRNRFKRNTDRLSVSLDLPVGDEEEMVLGDILADDFNIEREAFGNREEGYSRKMRLYLNRLSNTQKKVLNMITIGFMPDEIQEELHITEKEYSECRQTIQAYRNISVLF